MSKLRKATRSGQFSIVPNDLWERTDLSYRSRGLLVSMTSKPDDWSFRLEYFVERGTEGLDAIKTSYRELRAAGYVRLVRVAAGGGHYESETWVADEPVQAWAEEYAAGHRRGVVLRSVPDGGLEDDVVDGPTPSDRKWEIHSRPEVDYPESGQPTSLTTLTHQETTGSGGDLTTRAQTERSLQDDDRSDDVPEVQARPGGRPDWAGPGRPPPPDRLAEVHAVLGKRSRPRTSARSQERYLERLPAFADRDPARHEEVAARALEDLEDRRAESS